MDTTNKSQANEDLVTVRRQRRASWRPGASRAGRRKAYIRSWRLMPE